MNAAIVEADRVSNAGAALGEKLWLGMEAASDGGFRMSRAVLTFESFLEQINSNDFTGTDEAFALFHASAMLSIRMVVSAERRRKIDATAADTYGDFVSAQFDQAA